MNSQIEAVIFDLDGVITDTASYHYKAWKKLADELGIYFDKKINELLKGIDRIASLEIILRNSNNKYSAEEKKLLADKKNEYYKQLIGAMTPEDVLPGAVKTLKNLKARGYKTALASASKNAFAVIDKLELREYFDYIVDAAKVKNSKPDPEVFLTAAENMNVNPHNCIGVEDAEAGIRAIKSANMYAVGIGDKKILGEADDVIAGLDKFDIDKYTSISR